MNRMWTWWLTIGLAAGGAAPAGHAATIPWNRCLSQKAGWYARAEALRIAGNVLLYQRESGGWPKNVDMARPLSEAERAEVAKDRPKTDSTIDNGATYTQMRLLAKVYAASRQERCRDSVLRGLGYLLAAQYANGGWPQFHPGASGYHRQITFNDGAMIGVLELLRDVAARHGEFSFVDDSQRARARAAVQRGLGCILKCQIRVAGKLKAWCAQHDAETLAPCKARSYELPSISGGESVGIVRFLMDIEQPSEEVVEAVQSAVAWLDRVKIKGVRVVTRPVASAPGGSARVVVADTSAGPLWARFYEIGTNRPFFCSRDGVVRYSLAEISHERRNGYAWYVGSPKSLLERDYPKWQARHAPGKNVLARP